MVEHKEGDLVSGRMVEVSEGQARVELGEGVYADCRMDGSNPAVQAESQAKITSSAKPDLSSLGSMLQARWKGATPAEGAKPEPMRSGQIRKFRIVKLDPAGKKIAVELA